MVDEELDIGWEVLEDFVEGAKLSSVYWASVHKEEDSPLHGERTL